MFLVWFFGTRFGRFLGIYDGGGFIFFFICLLSSEFLGLWGIFYCGLAFVYRSFISVIDEVGVGFGWMREFF